MFYASAFWFPISITITAKNAETIGYKNRMFLFQTALWFLVLFKKSFDEFKNANEPKILNERKYKEIIDVLPYTTDILIEFIDYNEIKDMLCGNDTIDVNLPFVLKIVKSTNKLIT